MVIIIIMALSVIFLRLPLITLKNTFNTPILFLCFPLKEPVGNGLLAPRSYNSEFFILYLL